MFKVSAFASLTLLSVCLSPAFAQREAAGVRVPEGFNISLFADDDMAHDVHSLTFDSRGRLVVSGPGYIRFLLDTDDDGKADRVKQFVDGPKSGAQGMFWAGRSLLCSGNNGGDESGLLIYRDDNRDDKADKKPEKFLGALAGGEHHVHSIQKGPDGWWYVIAGNYAGVTAAYVQGSKTTPIKNPYAGVVMRIDPKFTGGEVIADGFRNAYDFGFTRQGDIFTFDSDGERDVSLPWYRPTRVFQVTPMSNAGWVSRSWKRPGYFLDMPPVVGSFGRGSPSGIVVYKHTQFPSKYQGAVIGLDWTYGRVIALPLEQSGSTWKSKPVVFMEGVGSFGFAPTDAEVGPDGSLYVSIGGRGTRGGVYKVTYGKGGSKPKLAETEAERLTQILEAPQPLSSWSRTKWESRAKRLGRDPFVKTILREGMSDATRMRAMEIMTELFGGVKNNEAAAITKSKSAALRARTAWSIGRRDQNKPDPKALAAYVKDKSPLVQRFAYEAMQCANEEANWEELAPLLVPGLTSKDRFVRQMASRIVSKVPGKYLEKLVQAVRKTNVPEGTISLGFGLADRQRRVVANVLSMGMGFLEPFKDGQFHTIGVRIDGARAMQMALGDVGPGEKRLAVYEGYAPRVDLVGKEKELNPIRSRIAKIFPTGDERLDFEVSRVISMLAPLNDDLLDKVLAKVTEKSDPVSDIHYLLVASRIAVDRTSQQTAKTAKALAALDAKIKARSYPQDANWNARINELYATLVQNDPQLPMTLVKLPEFGRPPHVVFLSQLPKENLNLAINAFSKKIDAEGDDFTWTNDIVFVMGESKDPSHKALVREQLDNIGTRNAAVMVLSREPLESDRELFVEALESPDRGILISCVNALSVLSEKKQGGSPDEIVRLVRTARRLGGIPAEFQLRETAVKLLQQHTGQNFGFEFGESGYTPQSAVLGKWSRYIETKYPNETGLLMGGEAKDLEMVYRMMARTDWKAGDAARGKALFEKLSCAQCHGGSTALGPDLGGVTSRFSDRDLFAAIVAPNKDVSTRYQTTLIETSSGKAHQGLVIYRSVDGLLLRTLQNQTIRIEGQDIEASRALSTSLMPSKLLKDAKPADLSDLFAYLKTLEAPKQPVLQPSPDPMKEDEKKAAARK